MSEYCDVKTDVIGNLYMEVGKKTRAYGHDFGTF